MCRTAWLESWFILPISAAPLCMEDKNWPSQAGVGFWISTETLGCCRNGGSSSFNECCIALRIAAVFERGQLQNEAILRDFLGT